MFFEASKNLDLNFTWTQKIFQRSYGLIIKNRNLLQTISFRSHQFSRSYDNYSELQTFWSKKFILAPKKKASFKALQAVLGITTFKYKLSVLNFKRYSEKRIYRILHLLPNKNPQLNNLPLFKIFSAAKPWEDLWPFLRLLGRKTSKICLKKLDLITPFLRSKVHLERGVFIKFKIAICWTFVKFESCVFTGHAQNSPKHFNMKS